MAEIKTRPTDASVEEFLNNVTNARRREDGFKVLEMMREVSGEEPRMWGDSIIGFGQEHYKYASGREGDMPRVGFSPRKQNLTLYLNFDYDGFDELMARLGKAKTSVACLYINKLADVDMEVLREMVRRSLEKRAGESG
jgi:hypothetical protein